MKPAFFRNLKAYFKESIRTYADKSPQISVINLVRLFLKWNKLQDNSSSPLDSKIPWITLLAIEFLEKHLDVNMKVFEYGSGGSTLFFAKRVKEVISVEHDPKWFALVMNKINQDQYRNCQCNLIEANDFGATILEDNLFSKAADPFAYTSLSLINPHFQGKNFENYVKSIDLYEDEYFDVILIDGRSRPSCFIHALPKIKKGGYIVWDNTDQEHYIPAINSCPENYKRTDYPGPTPYASWFSFTSIWQRDSTTS